MGGADPTEEGLRDFPSPLFAQIQRRIFTPKCSTCHSGPHAPMDLQLDEENSYSSLVNQWSKEGENITPAGVLRVRPGEPFPTESYLVAKIIQMAQYRVGKRMPASGPPYLSMEEIRLIQRWIAEGALQ